MSRRRKTNHLKPRPKTRHRPPRAQRRSIVLTLVDADGDLIDIDITNDPTWAELAQHMTTDCPYCNGDDHGRGSEHQ